MTSGRFPVFLLSLIKQLGGRHWWLSFVLWIIMVGPAAALELRVAIEDGVRQVTVGSSTKAVVRDGSGRVLGEIAGMNAFDAQARGSGVAMGQWQANQIWIEPSDGGY